jgi:hypothetical protein
MADRNIRNIDPALCAALKSEAATAGVSLDKYCIQILESRHDRTPAKPEPLLPAGMSPGPGGGLLDAFHVKNGSAPAAVPAGPAQFTGSAAEGMWPTPLPTVGQEPPMMGGHPATPAPRPKCSHGWMNAKLCPQCRAVN